jgi:hypothetical protein
MSDLRDRWTKTQDAVSRHQGYEGRSTRSGASIYLDAYDTASSYIHELEKRLRETRVEIVNELGRPSICRVWREGVLVFFGEDLTASLRTVQPPVHMVSNGGMLHALHDVSMAIQSVDDWESVTCKICLQQRPPVIEELPAHQDYDGVCPHVGAYFSVISHTRGSTQGGPDYCVECSEAIQEWVAWPCPRAERAGARKIDK